MAARAHSNALLQRVSWMHMLRQSMVVETQKLETKRQKTLIRPETEFETVAVLDIPKIKKVLCGEDLVEAGYLMQVLWNSMGFVR